MVMKQNKPANNLTAISKLELDAYVHRTYLTAGMIFLATVVMLIANWQIYHYERLLLMLGLPLFIVQLIAWKAIWLPKIEANNSLEGEGAVRLLELSKEHIEIDQFITDIRALKRQIVWRDLYQANSWLHEQRLHEQVCASHELNKNCES